MKNTVKNVLIAVLFVAFLSAAFFACKENKQRAKAEKTAKESEKVLNYVTVNPTLSYTDKNGEQQKPSSNHTDDNGSAVNKFVPFIDSVYDALGAAQEQSAPTGKEPVVNDDSLNYYRSVTFFQAQYIDSLKELVDAYKTKVKQIDIDAELARLKADSLATAKAKMRMFDQPYFLGQKRSDETRPSPLTITVAAPSFGYYYRTGSTTLGAAAVITSGRFRMANSIYKYLNQAGIGGSTNISMEGFSTRMKKRKRYIDTAF